MPKTRTKRVADYRSSAQSTVLKRVVRHLLHAARRQRNKRGNVTAAITAPNRRCRTIRQWGLWAASFWSRAQLRPKL